MGQQRCSVASCFLFLFPSRAYSAVDLELVAADAGAVFQTAEIAAGVGAAVAFRLDCSFQKHQTEDSESDHEVATGVSVGSVVP